MLNSLLIALAVSTAHDSDAEFTILAEEQAAPFEGVLLNPQAAAEVLATHEEQQAKCDLTIEFEVDKAGTQCKLDKELLQIRIEAITEELIVTTEQKDLEIAALQEAIKKQSPQRKWWWFAGGVVLGGATYYGIQQAAK
jgi:hypothetical protein